MTKLLEDHIFVPQNWSDRPSNPERVPSWIDSIYEFYGDNSPIFPNDYRLINEDENKRRFDNGTVNFCFGWKISPLRKVLQHKDKYWIDSNWINCEEPCSDTSQDVNLLPYMMESRRKRDVIPLSQIADTASQVLIHPEGIIVPRGAQINSYVIEYGRFPAGYKFQATTRSTVGRNGLDSVSTAGNINGGWEGILLCEVRNYGDHDLLMKIGAWVVQVGPHPNPESHKYLGQYQGQQPD